MIKIGEQFQVFGVVYARTPYGLKIIERVLYHEEPPILEQCGTCANAEIYEFSPDPAVCDLVRHVRGESITCRRGRPFEPGPCEVYVIGTPKRPKSLF